MNWTGGHLQRTKRQQGHITAKQRSYFAKSHKRALAGRHGSNTKHLNHQSSFPQSLQPRWQEKTQQELEPPEWLPKALWSSFLETKSSKEAESSEMSIYHESRKRHHDHTTTIEDPPEKHSQHPRVLQTSEELEDEIKRQKLLLRKDWFAVNDLAHSKFSVSPYHKSRIGKRRKLRQDDHDRVALVKKISTGRPGLAGGLGSLGLQPTQISVRLGSQIHSTQRTRLSNSRALTNTVPAHWKTARDSQDSYRPNYPSAQIPRRTSVPTVESFHALEEIATPTSIHAEHQTHRLEIEDWISKSASKEVGIRRSRSSETTRRTKPTELLCGEYNRPSEVSSQPYENWSTDVNYESERDDSFDNEHTIIDGCLSPNHIREQTPFPPNEEKHAIHQDQIDDEYATLGPEQILAAPVDSEVMGTRTFTWSASEHPSPRRSLSPNLLFPTGEIRAKSSQDVDRTSTYHHDLNRYHEPETQPIFEHQSSMSDIEDVAPASITGDRPASDDSRSPSRIQQSYLQAEACHLIQPSEDSQQPISRAADIELPLQSDDFKPNFETPIAQQYTKIPRPWTPIKATISKRLPVRQERLSDTTTINLVPRFLQAAAKLPRTQSESRIYSSPSRPWGESLKPFVGYAAPEGIARSTEVPTDRPQPRQVTFVKPKRFKADTFSKERIGDIVTGSSRKTSTRNRSWHFNPESSRWESVIEQTEDDWLERDDIED